MTTALGRIEQKAKTDRAVRFTSLAHVITPEFLQETWRGMNRKGAPGVDGETVAQFERELPLRVTDLWHRLRGGRYKAPPVRRAEIPKSNGKVRALGIPTVEDRLLQAAVARLVSGVFEPLFVNSSFGYRPGRSAHDALRALRSAVIAGQVMQIFEADIRAYFDNVNHDWLRRMLRERISDPVILRLIDKWLHAGVMHDGVVSQPGRGVPQGGPISPVLANVYLHYALDLWFEKRVKPRCRGQAHLVRFADDFVACFQYEADAKRSGEEIETRMLEFGLHLAPEKTRRLVFGRFFRERLAMSGDTPETFDFLGFKHVCATDRKGKFALVRVPSHKSCRRFLDATREWLKQHLHWRVRDQQKRLTQMLRGFYQYFALPHCGPKLYWVHSEVQRQWRRALRRRSQRSQTHWSYLATQPWFQLPTAVSIHLNV